jgi:hypothetical protein
VKEINDKGERQLQPREYAPRGPAPSAPVDLIANVIARIKVLEEQNTEQARSIAKHEEQIASIQMSLPRGIPKST